MTIFSPLPISGWWNPCLPGEIATLLSGQQSFYPSYFHDPADEENSDSFIRLRKDDGLYRAFVFDRTDVFVLAKDVEKFEKDKQIPFTTTSIARKEMLSVSDDLIRLAEITGKVREELIDDAANGALEAFTFFMDAEVAVGSFPIHLAHSNHDLPWPAGKDQPYATPLHPAVERALRSCSEDIEVEGYVLPQRTPIRLKDSQIDRIRTGQNAVIEYGFLPDGRAFKVVNPLGGLVISIEEVLVRKSDIGRLETGLIPEKEFQPQPSTDQAAPVTEQERKPECRFTIRAGLCFIIFQGEQFHLKSSRSLRDIAGRLAEPYHQWKNPIVSTREPFLDRKAKELLQSIHQDKKDEIAACKNLEIKENLEEELEKTLKYIKENGGYITDNGKILWKNTVTDNPKRAFQRNIQRGIDSIRKINRKFADHLDKYLKPGYFYTPPDDLNIRWIVDLEPENNAGINDPLEKMSEREKNKQKRGYYNEDN